MIVAAKATSFLLIAGETNAQEVAFNKLFAETLSERATLWVAPGAGHTEAFGRYLDEYEQRVIDFFESTLLK